MDAHDRRVLEHRIGLAEQPRALARRHGDDDCVRVELRRATPRAPKTTAAPPLERAAGRVAVHRPERLDRQDQVLVPARPSSAVRTVKRPASALGLVRAEVERRPDEDVPEPFDRTRRTHRAGEAARRTSRASARLRRRASVPSSTGIRRRSRSGRCRYRRSAGSERADLATERSSAITGSASRRRAYEPLSPMRSRKARYSVKQPSAMCCPLSGGGSGSPSRSGQRLHRAAERRPRFVAA